VATRLKVFNFAHPLTPVHCQRIADLAGERVEAVNMPFQIEPQYPLEPQVEALVDGLGLTPREWQTESFMFNLPSLNYGTAVLLAQLHGRSGYFPAIVRLRPAADTLPVQFEVAEVINLQAVRERARRKR